MITQPLQHPTSAAKMNDPSPIGDAGVFKNASVPHLDPQHLPLALYLNQLLFQASYIIVLGSIPIKALFLELSVMVTLRASLQEPLYSHTETAELPDGGEPRFDISSQRNGILRTKIFWFLENSPLT